MSTSRARRTRQKTRQSESYARAHSFAIRNEVGDLKLEEAPSVGAKNSQPTVRHAHRTFSHLSGTPNVTRASTKGKKPTCQRLTNVHVERTVKRGKGNPRVVKTHNQTPEPQGRYSTGATTWKLPRGKEEHCCKRIADRADDHSAAWRIHGHVG